MLYHGTMLYCTVLMCIVFVTGLSAAWNCMSQAKSLVCAIKFKDICSTINRQFFLTKYMLMLLKIC